MKRQTIWMMAPGEIESRLEPVPPLPPDEVLVQTAVSAISAGTEMLFYRGQLTAGMVIDETIDSLAGEISYPLKYGYAAVGKVVDSGSQVDPAWRDRWVFAFNPHESYFSAKPVQLLPLPPAFSPETAVFLPNMETAVSLVMDGRPVIGERVALFGQGVVGLLTTWLLAGMPLAGLVTVEPNPLRREWSRTGGATLVVDPAQPEAQMLLADALAGDGSQPGADLCYELSGNPEALNLAIAVTGFAGRIVVGSWYGQKEARLDLGGAFHRRHMQLLSSQVSTLHPRWHGRWHKQRRYQTAWTMLARLDPGRLITHRFAAAEAAAAYRLLAEEPETAVQVVFTYEK